MLRFKPVFAGSVLVWCALSAQAQQEPFGSKKVIEEIVITAQRREQLIQNVPTSVIAFTGEQLSDSGVDTLKDLQMLVPGLSLQTSSSIDNLRIIMRGVGSVGDSSIPPSVGTYIDGEYIARPGALLNTLLDLDAVEVLRGPQGTLFGRNSTVGVMNIRTHDPTLDRVDGNLRATVGSYDLRSLQGMLNFPFGDKVGARFAGSYTERDGWGRNTLPGEASEFGSIQDLVFRGKLRIAATKNFEAMLRYDYSKLEADGETIEVLSSTVTPQNLANLTFISGGMAPDTADTYDYVVNQRHFDNNDVTQSGVGLDLNFDFGNGYSFDSITAYRDWEYVSQRDPVRLPLDVNDQNFVKKTETFSQEFQVLSPGDRRFEYLLGLYYYDEKFTVDEGRDLGTDFCNTIVANLELAGQVPAGTAGACAFFPQDEAVVAAFNQKVESLSAFGQADFDITDQVRLTFGLRWTKDDLQGFYGSTTVNPVVEALAIATEPGRELFFDDDKLTYLVSLDYRPTDQVMLYARYTSGYKSGGFNADIPSTVPLTDAQRVFASEEAHNIELGVKTSWLDSRVVANGSWFSGKIDDFQDRAFDGIGFVVTNAGSLDISGVEFDIKARPVDQFLISLSGIYLDSEFGSYTDAPNLPGLPGTQDLTGQRPHFSPEWQISSVAQWTGLFADARLEWFARGEYAYISEQNINATTNLSSQTIQDSYGITNLRVGLGAADHRWQAILFVENVGDEGYCQVDFEQPFAQGLGVRDGAGSSLYRCVLGTPRIAGVRVSFNF